MTLSPDRPFLISPPFGSYFRSARAYSVLGSFTRLPRPGRTAQVLRTVRPLGREPDGEPKGWVNKLGLRNPGAGAARRTIRLTPRQNGVVTYLPAPPSIFSIALLGGDSSEWSWLEGFVGRPNGSWPAIVEINVSCPNIEYAIPELPGDAAIKRILAISSIDFIWKLPPVPSSVDAALRLADLGARYLHLSNTLPSPIGGLSGKVLREVNLPLVERTAVALDATGLRYSPTTNGCYNELQRFFSRRPDLATSVGHLRSIVGDGAETMVSFAEKRGWVTVYGEYIIWSSSAFPREGCELIAGGGIYTTDHVRQYRNAGATRFSLATVFMNPLRGYRIIREYGR